MVKTLILLAALSLMYLPVLGTDPANAQATRTWVSGVGDDANPCSRTAPCKTWAGAISKTAPMGEIECLDPGGFGAVTITVSITIDCTGSFGSALVSGTNAIVVNGAGITVTLRGISMNGLNTGLNGVYFLGGAALILDRVNIMEFSSSSAGVGIMFAPSTSAKLFVSDSSIINNGTSGNEAGIYIKPGSGAVADVFITRTQINNNFFGIIADGSGGGIIGGVVKDSVISGSPNNGITTSSTGSSVTLLVQNSTVSGNGYGLAAAGPNALIFATHTSISYNGNGLFGAVYSFGDNSLIANGANGTFASKIPQQ